MTVVEQIQERLDELAQSMNASVDSGRKPAIADCEEYGELLQSFLIEDASQFFEWAHKAFGRAA